MHFLRRWRRPILALTIFGVLYVVGYAYVRCQHYLIHRSGFAFGNTENHRITAGDFGVGNYQVARFTAVYYWLFTPMRWMETGYWYLRYPTDEPWPYYAGPNQRPQLTGDAREG